MDVTNTDHVSTAAPILALLNGSPLTPAMVEAAEGAALQAEQVECPVIHRFGPGVCVREVFMPADTFAIGHHQRFEQLNIFLKGRVTVINDDGSTRELVAPMCFTGPPGRKVGYVHEDVVWLNVYATNLTDVAAIEDTFLDKSAAWNAHHDLQHTMATLARQEDRTDFLDALVDLGVSPELVRQQSENEADQVPFPPGDYKVRLAQSPIEGRGLFATADIAAGEIIAPARIAGMRTPAGRYTNHAKQPNARMKLVNTAGDMALIATAPIAGCRGGANGDEITVDYRQCVAECFKFHSKDT